MLNGALYPDGFRADLTRCWQISCRGEPGLALLRALGVREAASAAGDITSVAFASQQMAWFCFQLGDVEQGLASINVARQIWVLQDDAAGQAWTGAMHAWLLLEAGLTDEACEDAIAAFALAEKAGDPATFCFATNVMGVVFWSCKQIERALDLCQQAVDMARSLDEPHMLGWWLINLGGVHSEFGFRADRAGDPVARHDAFNTALAINREAIDLADAHGDTWCLRLGLCNAAEYLAADDRAEAIDYINRCEHLPGPAGQRSTAHLLYTKAQVLIRLGRFNEALPACQQAMAMAEENRNQEPVTYAMRYMSEIYEGLGQFELALTWFKRFHDAHDKQAAETIQRQARIAEIRYQTNKFRTLADTEQRRAEHLARANLLDPLTGIANRRSFDEALIKLEAERRPFAIAMIDLDHFKSVNDRFSHLVGDEVLKRVGATLAEVCGVDALAVRMGGEEFALLIEGDDLDDARQLCLSLRRRFAAVPWEEIHKGLRVTASIGVTTSREAVGTRAVLALADARLYQAKLAGRDRVVSWTPTEATTVAV